MRPAAWRASCVPGPQWGDIVGRSNASPMEADPIIRRVQGFRGEFSGMACWEGRGIRPGLPGSDIGPVLSMIGLPVAVRSPKPRSAVSFRGADLLFPLSVSSGRKRGQAIRRRQCKCEGIASKTRQFRVFCGQTPYCRRQTGRVFVLRTVRKSRMRCRKRLEADAVSVRFVKRQTGRAGLPEGCQAAASFPGSIRLLWR